jgi:hypothetical protein
MGGVGKKLVTKTWMWETFLQGHILSVGGNALIAIARQQKKTSALKLDPKLQKGKRNNRKQTKKREK